MFFQALITGLMINKPDDHIEFIMESLSKVSSSLILTKKLSFYSIKIVNNH